MSMDVSLSTSLIAFIRILPLSPIDLIHYLLLSLRMVSPANKLMLKLRNCKRSLPNLDTLARITPSYSIFKEYCCVLDSDSIAHS